MRPKKKILPLLESVTITDAGSEGQSIAKLNDYVLFVKNAVPGDVVDVQITRKKSNYREGTAVLIRQPSEKRAIPECEHFGTCGGCKWQNMKYEWQLFYKQKHVHDCFTRLAKVEFPEIQKILPSEKIFFYRNKLEYTFSNKKWLTYEEISGNEEMDRSALGFHIPKMFDKVLDINKCFLQAEPSNSIRLEIKKYALENKLSFFDLRQQQGLLRNIIIRTTSTNELMLILSVFEETEEVHQLLNHISEKFPEITSLQYVINAKRNDTISDLEIKVFKGKDHITEKMEDLKFKIGPKSFYQTNSEQAYFLYKTARDFAQLTGDEVVYDLYTGTGTIANFIAKKAKKVIGIEYVDAAIVDAKDNSRENNISNTLFFAGDMKDVLNDDFISEHGIPDVIITDPPRVGMHEDVTKKILQIGAKKIVYVSCNPATQARDIALLDEKYKVAKVQPVDMFPQTHHVENVVLLELRTV
ncbi:MAG: 23S rRNA (uracil(1939)-C(5))-methyltransferase RlmD [Bacteroidia bacterium]